MATMPPMPDYDSPQPSDMPSEVPQLPDDVYDPAPSGEPGEDMPVKV